MKYDTLMEIQTADKRDNVDRQGAPVTDGALLDQFVNQRNADAFQALMNRHGAFVLGVSRRLTSHVQDAEDVFQACFLELVRKAASIREQQSLVGWLHTVAVRLARRANARRSRRRQKEEQAIMSKPANESADDISWRDACRVLEEELVRLPDDLRLPIILCLYEGHTQEEAAQQLETNARTLKDRIRRGREILRDRLVRRGVSLSILGTLLSIGNTQAAVPVALAQATLQGATAVASHAPLAGVVSTSVAELTGSTSIVAGWGLAAAITLGTLLLVPAAYAVWKQRKAPSAPVAYVDAKPAKPRGPLTLHRSFRGKQFDSALLQWSGPTPRKYARLEEEGLRITLPSANGPAQPVGVKLRYPVRGDFEMEATFEVLGTAPEQTKGGATLYFLVDSPDQDGVWLGKMMDPERGPVFQMGQRTKNREERFNKFLKSTPAENKWGIVRLRVERKGNALRFFAAEAGSGPYRALHEMEISDANASIVRLAADSAWLPDVSVDIRIVEFTITAQEFVGYEPRTP